MLILSSILLQLSLLMFWTDIIVDDYCIKIDLCNSWISIGLPLNLAMPLIWATCPLVLAEPWNWPRHTAMIRPNEEFLSRYCTHCLTTCTTAKSCLRVMQFLHSSLVRLQLMCIITFSSPCCSCDKTSPIRFCWHTCWRQIYPPVMDIPELLVISNGPFILERHHVFHGRVLLSCLAYSVM